MSHSTPPLLLPSSCYYYRRLYGILHYIFTLSIIGVVERLDTLFAIYDHITNRGATYYDIVGDVQRCPRLVLRN